MSSLQVARVLGIRRRNDRDVGKLARDIVEFISISSAGCFYTVQT